MLRIKFPIPDTENGQYDYGRDLSDAEYEAMLVDDYYRHEAGVRQVENAIRTNTSLYSRYNIKDVKDIKPIEDKNIWIETDGDICQSNGTVLTKEFLEKKITEGSMDILQVNMFAEDMDYDLQSELRYWMEDSHMVRSDNKLDSKTKIKRLPPRDIIFTFEDNEYKLFECKIVKSLATPKEPFKWMLIITKIEKN